MEVIVPLIIVWQGWIFSCTPVAGELEMSCVPVMEVHKKVAL